jgi:hypothetical protein
MRKWIRSLLPVVLAAAVASPAFMTGCAVHARVYDPYHRDYHVWVDEEPYYSQWERDTHRDHMDYDRRSDRDKKEYWDWRHNQH